MGIKLTYKGLDELYERFSKLEDNINDNVITESLNQIGIALSGKIRQNFYNQVNPYNEQWKPLKAGGRFKNGAFDSSAKILLDDGRLVNSINYNVKGTLLEIGTPVFYAQYHQEGLGVPQRAFLPYNQMPEEWNASITNIIEKVLNNLV